MSLSFFLIYLTLVGLLASYPHLYRGREKTWLLCEKSIADISIVSAIARADLTISQWRKMVEEHEKCMPEAVAVCRANFETAVMERRQMDADEEGNSVVG